jgi:O-antigen/teichoic acid export membrane protein
MSSEESGAAHQQESQKALGKQLRGSSMLLAGRIMSKGFNFGIQVAIVRLLTKDDYGAFAYGLALALAGEFIVKLGLGRGANRFVPEYVERGQRAEVMGTLALVTGTIVCVGTLCIAALHQISTLGLAGFPRGEGARVVVILALMAPIQAMDSVCIQTLACFSRPRIIVFRKHILAPGLRAAAVAIVFFAGGDNILLAEAYVFGGILGLIVCIRLALRELYAHGILPLPMSQWRVPVQKLVRFSFPLISSDLVFLALTSVTTAVVMMTDGESGVASMRAVVPAAELNLLVMQSFSLLFMPAAMRAYAGGGLEGLKEHHWQSAAWVAVLSFPFFALTFGVAPRLVTLLFGDAYAESAMLLAVLAVGQYFSVCLAFNNETLQILDRTRALVGTNVLTVVLGGLLALLLCPRMGVLGAAIAVTVARMAGTAARQVVLQRSGSFGAVPSSQLGIWFRVFVSAALIAGIGWVWQPPVVGQFIVAALVSLALLRSTSNTLELSRSFPELLRIPLVAKVVGA